MRLGTGVKGNREEERGASCPRQCVEWVSISVIVGYYSEALGERGYRQRGANTARTGTLLLCSALSTDWDMGSILQICPGYYRLWPYFFLDFSLVIYFPLSG